MNAGWFLKRRETHNDSSKVGTHTFQESKYMAIAVPITSCISEPITAISTIIHKINRGTVLYCL